MFNTALIEATSSYPVDDTLAILKNRLLKVAVVPVGFLIVTTYAADSHVSGAKGVSVIPLVELCDIYT